MTAIDKDLAGKSRRVLIAQLLMSLVVAAAFFALSAEENEWKALSAFYGGLVSVTLALVSIGGFKRANAIALSDPKQSMIILYIGAVVRFAAVIVLLGIGLGFLRLDAMAVFTGFALAQASYLMSVRDRTAARSSD
ncbi:MAG: ATP synthase subunit I [Ectothiorhodospiraceae bacterium]|nr:ATP synthase subunit I [Ectothiorhodospiraceae bacterium]